MRSGTLRVFSAGTSLSTFVRPCHWTLTLIPVSFRKSATAWASTFWAGSPTFHIDQ